MLRRIFAWSMVLILLVALVAVPSAAQDQEPQMQPMRADRIERAPKVLAMPGEVQIDLENLPMGARMALGDGAPMYLIVELDAEPLAVVYAKTLEAGKQPMSPSAQTAYVNELKAAQAVLVPQLEALGGTIISSYQKVYNGIQVRISMDKLLALPKLAGVKGVHRVPMYYPTNETSVPWIGADMLHDLGVDGAGVRIAIIDTGIDYHHAAFGGSGDPADFEANDNTIIEPYTFPTVKVVGGYDFAGPWFDPSSDDPEEFVPQPDPDPLDGEGHGSSMASTAGGFAVEADPPVGKGVAPAALLYAVKIFRDYGRASTTLTLDGIEWSVDPDGDGDVSDRVDVINMSLGGAFNSPEVPSAVAANNAVGIGVVVAAAAGNSGDVMYIHDAPGNAKNVIAVAASVDNDPADNAETKVRIDAPYEALYDASEGANSAPLFETGDVIGEIVYVGQGCIDSAGDEYLADPNGKVALIQRGTCSFQEKVGGVEEAGALGAIVFNHSPGALVNMALVSGIPAVFISQGDGEEIVSALEAEDGGLAPDAVVTGGLARIPKPELVNTIPDFSGRGPWATYLKPDIATPGFRIGGADVGTGVGVSKGSGTSPATAHAAGVAALLVQAHPDWTPAEIKAAMQNTATDLGTLGEENYPLSRQGAGLVNAYEAAMQQVLALTDSSDLSYGVVTVDQDMTIPRTIKLVNKGPEDMSYEIDYNFQFPAEDEGQGVEFVVPPTVTVPAFATVNVPVDMEIDAEALSPATYDFGSWTVPEYDGFVTFAEMPVITDTVTDTVTTTLKLPADEAPDIIRVPFHAIMRATSDTRGPASIDIPDYRVPYTVFGMENTGPVASSVYLMPAYGADGNEVDVEDYADIRYFGVESYQFLPDTMAMEDTMVNFAVTTFGPWHTPQPYWAEFHIYIDNDEDGVSDFVIFNHNLGAVTTGDDDDVFVPVIVDLQTGALTLPTYAPPYDAYLATLWTEFNAATMELPMTASDIGLTDDNTDFDFMIVAFDFWGNVDMTTTNHADAAHPPMGFLWAPPPGEVPANSANVAGVIIDDGYMYNSHTDILALYYNDAPGVDQAQLIPLDVGGFYWTFLMHVWKNASD